MLAFKLALRNILGAGLRTWLNVIVLSFSFIIIIWLKGLLEGWDRQARNDMIKWEIGGGQYWHAAYDPFDPFTLSDSHGTIPDVLNDSVNNGSIVPVLLSQGTIYPNGRMQSVLIKGISPEQEVLALPSSKLKSDGVDIPAIIGRSMAESTQLKEGEYVTVRWRDKNGTFDATEIKISAIFETNVPTVDVGQVWLPIDMVREMMLLPGEATLLITDREGWQSADTDEWVFKDQETLLSDIETIIKAKSFVGIIIWAILLMMAMLAVFDTQVLSIFRRQKEIGTYVALGYTRRQVVGLFTVEGTMNSFLAALLSAAYGVPFLARLANKGWTMPIDTSEYGIAIAQTLFPIYSTGLVISTVLIVTMVTAVVSYWPSRRIAKMNPTDALRGKLQ